jgi:hypothetical protein
MERAQMRRTILGVIEIFLFSLILASTNVGVWWLTKIAVENKSLAYIETLKEQCAEIKIKHYALRSRK